MRQHQKILAAILCSGVSAAHAVYLDPDGLGQALIYPYYTVRSTAAAVIDGGADDGSNPHNTYLSVTNTDSVGKAVRVRLLEGAAAREVASFNVFLAPGDMWTGAVVPDGDGAKVITADRSCTEPPFTVNGGGLAELALRMRNPNEAPDLAATREGFAEMIEMATIKAGSPTALAIAPSGTGPANCARVQGDPGVFAADLDAPRGALMGTLTLINVANGRDATVNAEALGGLTTQAFFRPGADASVDFYAPEVTPASVITTSGKRYRLAWSRGVDAVTSVFMQSAIQNEYVLDIVSGSLTDWVMTMPTRHFYRRGAQADLPFVTGVSPQLPQCETVPFYYLDRETRIASTGGGDFGYGLPPLPHPNLCYSSTVVTIVDGALHVGPSLEGSINREKLIITDIFQNGWIRATFGATSASSATSSMDALATSTVTDLSTGASTTGALRVLGLPIVGFSARSFSNGTLTCATGACQGNYASAFPHKAVRTIVNAP